MRRLRELSAGHIGTQNFQTGAYDQQGNNNARSGIVDEIDQTKNIKAGMLGNRFRPMNLSRNTVHEG